MRGGGSGTVLVIGTWTSIAVRGDVHIPRATGQQDRLGEDSYDK